MNKCILPSLVIGLSLASCSSEPKLPMDRAGGAYFFETTCIPCHGKEGRGDGPTSAELDPSPRDLSDKEWQASVDDEYLRTIIRLGGAGVGKSPIMPANPQLNGNEATLNGLVAHVRDLIQE